MKNKLILICVNLLLTASAVLGNTGLVFSVDTDIRTIRLDDQVTLTFQLTGDAITNIVSNTENAQLNSWDGEGLHSRYTFVPQKEGECRFGPYTISFNGETFSSKPLIVQVLPKWSGKYGTFFRIDHNTLALGDRIEFVQETWSPKRMENANPQIKMKSANNDYEISIGRSSTSFSLSIDKTGRQTNYYYRNTWFVQPKRSGVFKITADLFKSLPDGVKPPDLTVTVKERAQPSSRCDSSPRAEAGLEPPQK